MIVFAEDGTIVGAQDVQKLFLLSEEEVTNQHINILFSAPFKGICMSLALESMRKKEPVLAEGQRKNGTRFPLSLMITQVPEEAKTVYIANVEKLKSDESLITVTKTGTIVACNSHSESLFNRSFHQVCGTPISSLIPAIGEKAELIAKENRHCWVTVGKDEKGNQIGLSVSVEPGVSGFINIRAENLDLRHSQMGVFLTIDSDGTIIESSRYQHYYLLGYSSEDLIGKNISTLLPELDIENYLESEKAKKLKTSESSSLFTSHKAFRTIVKLRDGTFKQFIMNIWRHKADKGEVLLSLHLKPFVIDGDDIPPLAGDQRPGEALKSIASYIIEQEIDEATCGNVYTATNKKTGESVVVKVQKKSLMDANQKERINLEYQVGQRLNHPNVINYLDQIEVGDHVVTVMERGNEGNLDSYTNKKGKLTEMEARTFFRQLVDAVSHCHDNNCVHGDIKLSNIVLKEGVLKLIDFSACKQLSENPLGKRATFCGTTQYVAPEVVTQNIYPGKMADIWSLGVCLYVMVTGNYPFGSIADSISGKFTIPEGVSPDCVDLIRNILQVDTSHRFSLEQIMRHQWMNPQEPAVAYQAMQSV